MADIWELAIGQASTQHGHGLDGMRQPHRLQRGIMVVNGRHVHHGGWYADPADVSSL
ncbi:hypothetical protein ACIBQ3_34710 [Streptomyces rubiginosohelvolus]|uniref:hypothetical protein n=1 Tax=Streptomyces rubiginosohelvolus TaxID=67362 RepID=UPI003792EEE5